MITVKASELKKEYDALFLVAQSERGTAHEKKFATCIWKELINKCNPTRKEFNEITSYLLVTSEVFYLVMKKSGFWSD